MVTDSLDAPARCGPAARRASLLAIPVAGATLLGGEANACFPEVCEYFER